MRLNNHFIPSLIFIILNILYFNIYLTPSKSIIYKCIFLFQAVTYIQLTNEKRLGKKISISLLPSRYILLNILPKI